MSRKDQRNLILAVIVFLFVNFSIPFSIGYKWSRAGQASLSWPIAPGRVINSQNVGASYEYQVGPVTYQNGRVRFGLLGGAGHELQNLTNGAPVQVSYHPTDPSTAVLLPGVSAGTKVMTGIGLAGVFVCSLAAFAVWKYFR
jgi:hypothetical protein